MFSINQQSVNGANVVANANGNVYNQWHNTIPFGAVNGQTSYINYQNQQQRQQQTNLNVGAYRQIWQNQPSHNIQHQQKFYYNHPSPSNQFPQVQYLQRPVCDTTIRQLPAPHVQHGMARNPHQARITLIPNMNGSLKTIIKRKRKRTMFTTEQVEVLESVFKSRPYISRDDRKILVDQLKINDTSIKVWFQNRRLRGKREAEEQAEAELYVDHEETAEQLLYPSDITETTSSDESVNGNIKAAQLDRLEEEITDKVDVSGFISLDDDIIGKIVDIIDEALPADFDLSKLTESATPNQNEAINDTSYSVPDDTLSNEGSTCASTMYEPISPATCEKSDEEEDKNCCVWKQYAPEDTQSLQKLFDLHFC